jgi:phosphomethylpyrimidine synthase
MMTQIELAKKGIVSPQMAQVIQDEGISQDLLLANMAAGTLVIPANPNHKNLKARGIGKGLNVKINANIGSSSDFCDLSTEMKKLEICMQYGADAVMDLSTGGDINKTRREVLAKSTIPVGNVPIYQAGTEAIIKHGAIVHLDPDILFQTIEQQAIDGMDFMTVHCGVTLAVIDRLRKQRRLTDVVSRGGAFLIGWMLHNEKENPLYEQFDRLLEIAYKYDITLSLGDGLRPGSLADATDRPQIEELITLGELVDRAREANVQVIVEGPGHVPLDQIVANVQLQKRLCHGAPFYVLGPLVTDIGAGYDHITGAIGGAIAGAAGADFLCYVTPAEHLSLPDIEDVKAGIIASRIAAHAADIVRTDGKAAEWDRKMSSARKRLDWEQQINLSLNPEKIRGVHNRYSTKGPACSMCGDFCAMALVEKYLGISVSRC